MTPHLGQSVILYGGLDNSLFEHAAVVTFVHQNYKSTLEGQIGVVNLRVFLDSHVADRVLKFVPLVESRQAASAYNALGAGYVAYIYNPEEFEMAPPGSDKDDGIPPIGAMAAVTIPHGWVLPETAQVH